MTGLTTGSGFWAGFAGLSQGGGLSPSGSSPTPTPGAEPTTFSITPTVHYHPNTATTTLGANDRIEAANDIMGFANASAPAGLGAFERTDARGIKYWLFNGTERLFIANALVASSRGITTIMIGRNYRQRTDTIMLSPRYATYTSPTVNTRPATSVSYMRTVFTGSGAPYLQAQTTPLASSITADAYKVIPPCNLHVATMACRTTANGGTRAGINKQYCDTAQVLSVTNMIGGVLGGITSGDNTENASISSTGSIFAIYELAIFVGELTNAQVETLITEALANHDLPESYTDGQLVFEGDSITESVVVADIPQNGTNAPAFFANPAAQATDPGAMVFPATLKVLNVARGGSTTTGVTTRRDDTTGYATIGLWPGGASKNAVMVHIGHNDLAPASGNKTAATLFTDVKALIYNGTTGWFDRGFRVFVASNIQTNVNATQQTRIDDYRTLIMDSGTLQPTSTFLTDVLANTGQTYEGLLKIVPLSEIAVGGVNLWKTPAQVTASEGTYMSTDGVHITITGFAAMVSGGDTASNGFGAMA